MERNNIKQLIKTAGINANKLANLTGLTDTMIGKILSGRSHITTASAIKIAKALDLDPLDILIEQAKCEIKILEKAKKR